MPLIGVLIIEGPGWPHAHPELYGIPFMTTPEDP